jgi:hypothetical protein
MTGKLLSRTVCRRCRVTLVWAMMPAAMLTGRSVSGCISPTGHFEPGCHCQAMQASATSTPPGKGITCQCHCPCCQGKTCCCCNGQSTCCKSVAKDARRSEGNGLQSGDRCRPYSIYVVTPAVSTSAPSGNVDHSTAIAIVALVVPSSLVATTIARPTELNTGPPPGNLVVSLHRFLI